MLKSSAQKLPADAVVKSPVLMPGAIPAPPAQIRETRFAFDASREKLAALGLTIEQLNAKLAGIPGGHDFSSESFTAPDGRTIPYADIGVTRRTEVLRPLVIP